ncbi:MAG: CTP--2,3-di-O-geranylgeranyl-sn-glycero-1-phosphate cytidyltransferase [archaeon]
MSWTFIRELKRKAFHLLILFVIGGFVIIQNNYSKQIALICLVGLLVFFLLAEYFRLELGFRIPIFDQIIRPKEREHYYGVIYFLSGTIICLAVFDFRIALAALLMTTFGDMSAALIGKKYGRTLLFKNKTLSGTLSELAVNIIVGFFVLTNAYIIIAMAFVATFVETFVEELDDNLLIPLFTGFSGQILLILLL